MINCPALFSTIKNSKQVKPVQRSRERGKDVWIGAEISRKTLCLQYLCWRGGMKLRGTWSSSFSLPLVLVLTSVLRSQWSCVSPENKTTIVVFEFVLKRGWVIWAVTKTKVAFSASSRFCRLSRSFLKRLNSSQQQGAVWIFTCYLHTFLHIWMCSSSLHNVS